VPQSQANSTRPVRNTMGRACALRGCNTRAYGRSVHPCPIDFGSRFVGNSWETRSADSSGEDSSSTLRAPADRGLCDPRPHGGISLPEPRSRTRPWARRDRRLMFLANVWVRSCTCLGNTCLLSSGFSGNNVEDQSSTGERPAALTLFGGIVASLVHWAGNRGTRLALFPRRVGPGGSRVVKWALCTRGFPCTASRVLNRGGSGADRFAFVPRSFPPAGPSSGPFVAVVRACSCSRHRSRAGCQRPLVPHI